MLCKTCKKKDKCIKLCSEAEKYVDKDFVSLKEMLLEKEYPYIDEYISTENFEEVWNLVDLENSNRLKTAIRRLREDGKSTREIVYYVPCVRSYVIKVLNT